MSPLLTAGLPPALFRINAGAEPMDEERGGRTRRFEDSGGRDAVQLRVSTLFTRYDAERPFLLRTWREFRARYKTSRPFLCERTSSIVYTSRADLWRCGIWNLPYARHAAPRASEVLPHPPRLASAREKIRAQYVRLPRDYVGSCSMLSLGRVGGKARGS